MVVILGFIGTIRKMLTLKYLVKRNMFVRLGLIKLLLRILILLILVLIVLFITKR